MTANEPAGEAENKIRGAQYERFKMVEGYVNNFYDYICHYGEGALLLWRSKFGWNPRI